MRVIVRFGYFLPWMLIFLLKIGSCESSEIMVHVLVLGLKSSYIE
jgi:hypothetical protein